MATRDRKPTGVTRSYHNPWPGQANPRNPRSPANPPVPAAPPGTSAGFTAADVASQPRAHSIRRGVGSAPDARGDDGLGPLPATDAAGAPLADRHAICGGKRVETRRQLYGSDAIAAMRGTPAAVRRDTVASAVASEMRALRAERAG